MGSCNFYAPRLKPGGAYSVWNVCPSVRQSVRPSVRPSPQHKSARIAWIHFIFGTQVPWGRSWISSKMGDLDLFFKVTGLWKYLGSCQSFAATSVGMYCMEPLYIWCTGALGAALGQVRRWVTLTYFSRSQDSGNS